MRKRILGLITLFMIFLVSAPPMTGVLDEPRMAFAPASDVKLKTFNINIEKIDINTPTRSTAVPSAMVTAKVELQNLRMLAIKDVVLSVTLLDQQEKIVSEFSGLVYVPYNQNRSYYVQIMSKSWGSFNTIAEVISSGRSTMTDPYQTEIPPTSLILQTNQNTDQTNWRD